MRYRLVRVDIEGEIDRYPSGVKNQVGIKNLVGFW